MKFHVQHRISPNFPLPTQHCEQHISAAFDSVACLAATRLQPAAAHLALALRRLAQFARDRRGFAFLGLDGANLAAAERELLVPGSGGGKWGKCGLKGGTSS